LPECFGIEGATIKKNIMKKYSTKQAIKMMGLTVLACTAMLNPAFCQKPAIDNGLLSYTMAASSSQQVKFRLPLDIRTGDRITGTVVEEPKKTPKEAGNASATLEGVVIEIDGKKTKVSDRVISFIVPAGLTSIPFLLKNSAGQVIEQGQIPVFSSISSPFGDDFPIMFSPAKIAQPGQPLKVAGSFDGNTANTNITLNGQPCEIIAESPRMSYVQVPATAAAGVADLAINENNTTTETKVNVAVLNLTANKTNLRKGEKATVTVTITGLQGLEQEKDCKIEVTNVTPTVVRIKNTEGNSVNKTVPKGQSGEYKFSFDILGISQGNFGLEGLLFCTIPTGGTADDFRDRLRKTKDFFELEELLVDLNRRKDDDYRASGGQPGPNAAWLWERIRAIMDRLEQMGWVFNPDGTMTRPAQFGGAVLPVR
jgi:hypothetical protein